ncbi:replicative DNA helicase, partial [Streptomyces roseolus]
MSVPEPMDDPWADGGPSDRLPVRTRGEGRGEGRGRGRSREEQHERGSDGPWDGGLVGFERVPPQDLDAEQSV